MQYILSKRGLLGGALALTVALGAVATAQAQDQGQSVKAGDLVISQAWTRATPGGAKVGGGYLTIENKGPIPREFRKAITDWELARYFEII